MLRRGAVLRRVLIRGWCSSLLRRGRVLIRGSGARRRLAISHGRRHAWVWLSHMTVIWMVGRHHASSRGHHPRMALHHPRMVGHIRRHTLAIHHLLLIIHLPSVHDIAWHVIAHRGRTPLTRGVMVSCLCVSRATISRWFWCIAAHIARSTTQSVHRSIPETAFAYPMFFRL